MRLFSHLGSEYNAERFDLDLFPPVVSECYGILSHHAHSRHYADLTRGKQKELKKSYWVFVNNADLDDISRPFRQTQFITSYEEWELHWRQMIGTIDVNSRTMAYPQADQVIYSASIAFFAVIDIWNRASRKINGTFLEWLLGNLLVKVTGYKLGRHIALDSSGDSDDLSADDEDADDEGKVPTDIVLDPGRNRYKLVFPVKTSTRERINQIFTHQRILDTEFPGQYRSALFCVSECQLLKKKKKVQETCVPRQINFNEQYVAHIDTLYYLDPPFAYVNDALTVPVRRISDLFRQDLSTISAEIETSASISCAEPVSVINCNLNKGHSGEHLFIPPRGVLISSRNLREADISD